MDMMDIQTGCSAVHCTVSECVMDMMDMQTGCRLDAVQCSAVQCSEHLQAVAQREAQSDGRHAAAQAH